MVVNAPESVNVAKPPVLARPSDRIKGDDDDERGRVVLSWRASNASNARPDVLIANETVRSDFASQGSRLRLSPPLESDSERCELFPYTLLKSYHRNLILVFRVVKGPVHFVVIHYDSFQWLPWPLTKHSRINGWATATTFSQI
jgi:hypothetical protein